MARAKYLNQKGMSHVLALLMPENRLICEVMLHTGLRLGDVLTLRKEQIKMRFTIIESKTKKKRTVSLTKYLCETLRGDGREGFCFPHKKFLDRHRTRQAVWRDVKRAAAACRYRNISPHSTRKIFAVNYYGKHNNDLKKTQKILNHDNDVVTMLYALADKIG